MSTFPTHRKDEAVSGSSPAMQVISHAPAAEATPASIRPYPTSPLTHIFIFTSILAPVALFPYLAVRRHLLRIHTQLAKMNETSMILQRDLKAALVEASVRKEEQERVRGLVGQVRREVEDVKRGLERREVEGFEVRKELRELMQEREKTRMQLSTLKDLGKSLADVAAFMHEVEVEQGFVYRPHDGRGIERIRHLAYRLESFQTDLKAEMKDPEQTSQTTKDGEQHRS